MRSSSPSSFPRCANGEGSHCEPAM
jgi:hypothetical protein